VGVRERERERVRERRRRSGRLYAYTRTVEKTRFRVLVFLFFFFYLPIRGRAEITWRSFGKYGENVAIGVSEIRFDKSRNSVTSSDAGSVGRLNNDIHLYTVHPRARPCTVFVVMF